MNTNNTNKMVFITGANGGLGMETIKWLIEDGIGHVVMAGRTKAKVDKARQELLDTIDRKTIRP